MHTTTSGSQYLSSPFIVTNRLQPYRSWTQTHGRRYRTSGTPTTSTLRRYACCQSSALKRLRAGALHPHPHHEYHLTTTRSRATCTTQQEAARGSVVKGATPVKDVTATPTELPTATRNRKQRLENAYYCCCCQLSANEYASRSLSAQRRIQSRYSMSATLHARAYSTHPPHFTLMSGKKPCTSTPAAD
jgi:hypothetical protein